MHDKEPKNTQKLGALVLAAGKGSRMHSNKPKVLHTFLGEPLLAHVHHALDSLFGQAVWTLIGHGAEEVKKAFSKRNSWILQEEQRGTGHAVLTALPFIEEAGITRLLIVNGDCPCLTQGLVRDFINSASDAQVALATLELDDIASYGRIVRKEGLLQGIVEAKEYTEEKYGPATNEVNAGMYVCDVPLLREYLPKLGTENAAKEYYLTDIIEKLLHDKILVKAIVCGQEKGLIGVNTPFELAKLEDEEQRKRLLALRQAGVILHGEAFRISPFANIAPGAELYAPCDVLGHSHIENDVLIEAHVIVKNSHIASGACIRSFSHIEGAQVGQECQVGPYARLRPGSIMEEASRVGNFVEMKNSRLGEGAKANHLTYLGDAEIGEGANVGAGTITCNYDGKNKHKTSIGKKAFIGSNSALVAPVCVGDGALIGAGSVIVKDVPAGHLGISRPEQKNVDRAKKE